MKLEIGEEIVGAILVADVFIYCVSNKGNFFVRDIREDFKAPEAVLTETKPQVEDIAKFLSEESNDIKDSK